MSRININNIDLDNLEDKDFDDLYSEDINETPKFRDELTVQKRKKNQNFIKRLKKKIDISRAYRDSEECGYYRESYSFLWRSNNDGIG